MGLGDKIANKTEEVVGKVKQGIGDMTGNERLEAEGVADQASAKAKQAAEGIKDAAKDVIDDVRDKLD